MMRVEMDSHYCFCFMIVYLWRTKKSRSITYRKSQRHFVWFLSMAANSTVAGVSPLLPYRNLCHRVTSARFKIAGRSAASVLPKSMSSNSITDSTELQRTTTLIMKDYMEWSKDMVGSASDGGPPRWFSPLECAAPIKDSPLLLYLPGDLIATTNFTHFL